MSPQEGTETCNPPVLDSGLIALVVTANDVHIVGKKGAALPGGSEVEVTNVATGEVVRGKSNEDGSFDIAVKASEYDTFSVRAFRAGKSSGNVTVDRGGASVGENSAPLSCSDITREALDFIEAAGATVQQGCTRDEDCAWRQAGRPFP